MTNYNKINSNKNNVDKNDFYDNYEDVFVTSEPENNKVFGTVVNCQLLRLREEPTTSSDVIKLINVGNTVEIIEETINDFYKVIDEEETIGYLVRDFVTINK